MAQILAERLSLYFQAYTLYSSVRPFGLSAILAGWDSPISTEGSDTIVERRSEGKPQLYMIEPSGEFCVRRFFPSAALVASLCSRCSNADEDVMDRRRATADVRRVKGGSWRRRRSRNSRSTSSRRRRRLSRRHECASCPFVPHPCA